MKMCNTCHRAGPSLEGSEAPCGSFVTCPKAEGWVDVDPGKDVVITCQESQCGKTIAISAHDIMTGKTRVDFHCAASPEVCGAAVVIDGGEHSKGAVVTASNAAKQVPAAKAK